LFELTVAVVGANQKFLEANHVPHRFSYSISPSHAIYYPGADTMIIKLIFTPGSGKILGAQIVGGGGVDKRIDVIATAIRGGMSVFDLEELELAYAPPYSSAKDPINVAGFVAGNILKGDVETFDWSVPPAIDPENDVVVDLRHQAEIDANGPIKDAVHIPLDQLRGRLSGLDQSKNYILSCAVGLRGYIGYRIMVQKGFRVKSIGGGYQVMKLVSRAD